jgi:hypothetical protein
VDQVEDYIKANTDVLKELAPFRKHEQLQLMWFLYNGTFNARWFRWYFPDHLGSLPSLIEEGGSWFQCSTTLETFATDS